jgi:hypothetical protein
MVTVIGAPVLRAGGLTESLAGQNTPPISTSGNGCGEEFSAARTPMPASAPSMHREPAERIRADRARRCYGPWPTSRGEP